MWLTECAVELRFLVVLLSPSAPLPTTDDVSVDDDTMLVEDDIRDSVKDFPRDEILDFGALNRARVMKSEEACARLS